MTVHAFQNSLAVKEEAIARHSHSMADGLATVDAAGGGRINLRMGQSVGQGHLRATSKQGAQSALPKPSGWFGSFSESESTYSEEGYDAHPEDPEFWVKNGGKDPSVPYPFFDGSAKDSAFFHESESGGAMDAWQAHFPAVQGSMAGNRNIRNGRWVYTPNGWIQDYVTENRDPATYVGHAPPQPVNIKEPQWFDNKVQQYDGFGRYKMPKNNGGLYLYEHGWLEKSVNTTLTCKDPGCNASVSIQAFDAAHMEAQNCKLSFHVHPTDYDDEWSYEVVSYLKINGAVATKNCKPNTRGCNSTAETPLYSCMDSFPIDHLVDNTGALVVEGKISHWVDECPHDGNLLSGVVMVTCMVRPPPEFIEAANATTQTTTKAPLMPIEAQVPLTCNYPGCVAKSLLQIIPAYALNGGKCLMSVNVTQTDFDDDLGLPEDVEFIAVDGENATQAPVSPGKNPCTSEYQGKPLKDDEKIFSVVKEYDVTDKIAQAHPVGSLVITGKISQQVDECGSNGNLLDGVVRVVCQPPADM